MLPSRTRSSLLLFVIASALIGGALYGALGWSVFDQPELASAGVVTSAGPVAAYSFDEGEGTTVEDITGDENTATIEGAEWVPGGKYGGAMKFDGAEEDRLTVPASEDLNLEEEFTLEAWVHPESAEEEYALILGKENSVSPHFAYVLYAQTPADRPEAFFAEGSKGNLEGEGGTPHLHAWTHIAVTDDGAHSRLYVNGQLVDTAESVPIPSTDGDLVIGGNKRFASFFDGKIDELRVYNRSLSEAEIQTDKATPIQTPQVAPVAEYSFDEGEGTTVKDLSGDENTATIEGAEWAPRGKYGGAMKFDSSEGDVLTVPAAEDLDLTEEFTLEAWIHPESEHEFENIFEKENSEEPFYSYLFTNHHGQLGAYFQEEPAYTHYSPGEEIEPHTWTHVALTYDGSRVYLYINGKEVEDGPAPSFISTDGALKIGGGNVFGPGHNFDGKIDEVRVYNRALDEAEVQSDAATPLQTPLAGPVAAYSFDEGEGTTVKDTTDNGHVATIEGAEWVPGGKYGGAMKFDGTSSCVSIADAADLHLGEEFTLESWIKPEGGPSHNPVIFKEAEGIPSYGLGAGLLHDKKPESTIGTSGAGRSNLTAGEAIEENVWSHIAVTFDGATMRLYVNGALAGIKTVENPNSGSEGPLTIGCDALDASHFKGRIDEVRIYNRMLGAGEVVTDMNTPVPPLNIIAEATDLNEEGELTIASLDVLYPDHQMGPSGEASHEPRLFLSLTTYGVPETESAKADFHSGESSHQLSAGTGGRTVIGRPYRFNACPIVYTGGGTPIPQPPGQGSRTEGKYHFLLNQVVEEAAKSQQCHGPFLDGTYVADWAIVIHGRFSYHRGSRVWIEHKPECDQWEEGSGDEPNPYEHCYATKTEAIGQTAKIDVIGDWVFEPAKKFQGASTRDNECVSLNGVLTVSPPEEDGGEYPEHTNVHGYKFLSGHSHSSPYKCHWEHPQNTVSPILIGAY